MAGGGGQHFRGGWVAFWGNMWFISQHQQRTHSRKNLNFSTFFLSLKQNFVYDIILYKHLYCISEKIFSKKSVLQL